MEIYHKEKHTGWHMTVLHVRLILANQACQGLILPYYLAHITSDPMPAVNVKVGRGTLNGNILLNYSMDFQQRPWTATMSRAFFVGAL